MEELWKTNRGTSQIPAFGNWDYADDLPITQYFESARQAGLIRNSGEFQPHSDLYSVAADYRTPPPAKQGKVGRDKRVAQGNYNKNKAECNINSRKQGAGKVFNVVTLTPPPTSGTVKKKQQSQPRRPPKAVDEDLYKIPPELLKRKRRLGFISRCLVPPCAV